MRGLEDVVGTDQIDAHRADRALEHGVDARDRRAVHDVRHARGELAHQIDVEDVAIGPAAADLASVVAGFLYLYASGELSRTTFSRQVAAFLNGYANIRPLPDPNSLRWHTAAALFIERASRAVTRIRPLGLAHLDRLLREASRVLDCDIDLS